MLSYKSKNRLLAFVLVLVLTVTITLKPVQVQADPITITVISLKVFSLLLGSMGVLAYVENQDGGVETFFNDFCDFLDSRTNADARKMFFDIFKNSVINNTKLLYGDIVDYVKEFFNSTFSHIPDVPIIPDIPDIPTDPVLPNAIKYTSFSNIDTTLNVRNKIMDYYNSSNISFSIIDDYITPDFRVIVNAYAFMISSGQSYFNIKFYYKGDEIASSYKKSAYSGTTYNNTLLDLRYNASYNSTGVRANFYMKDVNNGTAGSYSIYADFPPYIFDDYTPVVPDILPNILDIPSSGLAYPYELEGINISDFVGSTVDDLFSALGDISFEDFKSRIFGIPKVGFDAMPNTGINVNDDGIITDVSKPDIKDVPVVDVPENPTYPFTLKGLIDALLDMLKSLFIPKVGFLDAHVLDMLDKIKNKIGDNVYISLFNQLKGLNGIPIPDQFINGHKVLDAKHINSFADIIKGWQRWFFYIVIALYNLNNLYKLIRNGEMTGLSGGDKK